MPPRKPFLLRIDPELWNALEKWAADELRSVNGQIEYVLARAVKESGRGPRPRPTEDPKRPDPRRGPADES